MNATKFCWNCGTETSDAQEICVKCGVNLKKGGSGAPGEGKDWLTTLLLAIFVGGLGIHRFYVGLTGTAVVMLILWVVGWATVWFFGIGGIFFLATFIWALIDVIQIATGKFKDKDGNPLVKK